MDSTVCLWDLMSRNQRPIQRLTDFKDSVTKVVMTDSSIVASSIDGNVRVYDLRKGKLFEIDVGHPINSFDLANKSSFCVASCMDSTTRIVDLEDGTLVTEFTGH